MLTNENIRLEAQLKIFESKLHNKNIDVSVENEMRQKIIDLEKKLEEAHNKVILTENSNKH
jgi:hypothetical protein